MNHSANSHSSNSAVQSEAYAIDAPRRTAGQFVNDVGLRADGFHSLSLNVSASPKADPRRPASRDAWFVEETRSANDEEAMNSNSVTLEILPAPNGIAKHPVVALDGYTMAELEKLAITQTLQRCMGNRTRAARMLGISVRTLQRKLNVWNSAKRTASEPSFGAGNDCAATL